MDASSPVHAPAATPAAAPAAAWRVCLPAALALAVAMGIGRFAFTPLLPLMQREGLLDAHAAAWLASLNYLGYLLGALTAARLAARPRRLVLACLLGTAVVTAAAGLAQRLELWLVWRTAAGVLSAWTLVGVSTWSGVELARLGRSDAGGWVFCGVGTGIAAVGGLAWVAGGAGSAALWIALGALAVALALAVWRLWPLRPERQIAEAPAGAAADAPRPQPTALPPGSGRLVFCYGCFGFGYILPATYLPSLARTLVDDPRLFGLAWPVFGLAAALSTLVAGRALRRWHALDLWAACQAAMALGCALPLASHGAATIAASALLVGGSFMVATMTGLQHARSLCPANPAPLLARMTTAFALGQIAGPLVAQGLARLPGAGGAGIEATLGIAGALLLFTAAALRQAAGPLSARRRSTP